MTINRCVLVTSTFPVKAETFLRYEIPYLSVAFDDVEIVSTANQKIPKKTTEDMRRLEVYENVSYLGDINTLAPRIAIPPASLIRAFKADLQYTIASIVSFKKHVYRFIVATRLRKFLLDRYSDDGRTIFYSYWMNSGAVALASLDHRLNLRVTRAHGSDIYDKLKTTGSNTYTRFCVQKLDKVFTISSHGQKYIADKTGITDNIAVARLGVPISADSIITPSSKDPSLLNLVSCSIVDVNKRVHLIVDALSHIDGLRVRWTHIGGGPLLDEIKAAASKLGKNVETKFLGQMDNKEIHELFRMGGYDIFLNTSYSEGIPVAAMEAMSYGIPCIATDVGGTRELVGDAGGWLVPVDIKPVQLADIIKSFQDSIVAGVIDVRPREVIDRNYNAQKNFEEYARTLKNLKPKIWRLSE